MAFASEFDKTTLDSVSVPYFLASISATTSNFWINSKANARGFSTAFFSMVLMYLLNSKSGFGCWFLAFS